MQSKWMGHQSPFVLTVVACGIPSGSYATCNHPPTPPSPSHSPFHRNKSLTVGACPIIILAQNLDLLLDPHGITIVASSCTFLMREEKEKYYNIFEPGLLHAVDRRGAGLCGERETGAPRRLDSPFTMPSSFAHPTPLLTAPSRHLYLLSLSLSHTPRSLPVLCHKQA